MQNRTLYFGDNLEILREKFLDRPDGDGYFDLNVNKKGSYHTNRYAPWDYTRRGLHNHRPEPNDPQNPSPMAIHQPRDVENKCGLKIDIKRTVVDIAK